MTRQRLSPVDTVLLRAEDPANPMMVTGVMIFGAPIDFERLKMTVEDRLLHFAPFRGRVVQPRLPWGTPYWEDDPDFDLNYHLRRVTLPPPGGQAGLQEIVSQLASTPLDFSKPLWQLHLVENYSDDSIASSEGTLVNAGCALICRLHHCVADGVAAVHLLLSLVDTDPQAAAPATPPRKQYETAAPVGPSRSSQRSGYRAARWLVGKGLGLLVHPSRIADAARFGTEAATTLGELVLLPPDPDTVLRGDLGVTKRAAWSAPVPLADIKTIGRQLGGTVNDVLLTAMTGALRRYVEGRGESPDSASMRAAVPVDLRPPGAEGELGNQIGFVFLSLPVEVADPVERLRELRRRMDRHKDSLEAPLSLAMLKVLGLVPSSMQAVLIDFLGTKATTLMTNVIGPRERLYLAGAPLEALMFWVPQAGGVGVGVSIISYAGQVRLGVFTDAGLVPDPETIIAGFYAEFGALLAVAEEAGQPPSFRDLLARLDDTLVTLDAILDDGAGKGEGLTPPSGIALPSG
jgi:diacylglycerol O-acyltransferase